jgi:hypothetical protein
MIGRQGVIKKSWTVHSTFGCGSSQSSVIITRKANKIGNAFSHVVS